MKKLSDIWLWFSLAFLAVVAVYGVVEMILSGGGH